MDSLLIVKWSIYTCFFVILLYCENRLPRFKFTGRIKQDIRHIVLALVNGIGVVGVLGVPLFYLMSLEVGMLWQLAMPFWLMVVLGMVLIDIWQYWWHRLNHTVPFLWRFHQVHHADREMTLSTAFRFHPGEIALSMIVRMVLFTALGIPIESLLIYEAISLPIVWFHHANLKLPVWLDNTLRMVIVTPAMHEVHHSVVRTEMDSNYASVLSVWDRVFGSHVQATKAPVVFGVSYIPRWKHLSTLFLMPWRANFSRNKGDIRG